MGRHKRIEDEVLLARVREIVVREGISVSSRELAQEIGISSSVLFQRFGSKEELLFAALIPPAPSIASLVGNSEHHGDALAHLEQIVWEMFVYFRTFVPVLMPLASHSSFQYESFRQRHPDSPVDRLVLDLLKVLEEKRLKGEIDCPDVGSVAFNLMAVAHSLAMFEHIGVHDGQFSEGMVRQLTRALWRGLAPAGRCEPPQEGPFAPATHDPT